MFSFIIELVLFFIILYLGFNKYSEPTVTNLSGGNEFEDFNMMEDLQNMTPQES